MVIFFSDRFTQQNLPIYPPQKVQRIATELSTAVRAFPSLIPEVARFTFDNGSFVNLLRLRGTIPINYRGGSYSIPIAIWITQFHPDRAPVTYVIPTGDMEINPTHRHVDKAGLVYHGYLNQWKPSHNIIGLIHELINIFSGATPLYQRQTPKPLEQPKISHNISSSGDNQRKRYVATTAVHTISFPPRHPPPKPHKKKKLTTSHTSPPHSFLLARMQEKTRSEMEVAHKNKEPEFDALVKEKQALQQISDQMLSSKSSHPTKKRVCSPKSHVFPSGRFFISEKKTVRCRGDDIGAELNSLNEESLSASQRIEQLKATNKALEMWIAKYSVRVDGMLLLLLLLLFFRLLF